MRLNPEAFMADSIEDFIPLLNRNKRTPFAKHKFKVRFDASIIDGYANDLLKSDPDIIFMDSTDYTSVVMYVLQGILKCRVKKWDIEYDKTTDEIVVALE